jgi:hypothetical protein
MIGIGTPRSQRSIPRPIPITRLLINDFVERQRSLLRPVPMVIGEINIKCLQSLMLERSAARGTFVR